METVCRQYKQQTGLIWMLWACASLIIHCELVMVIVCSLISTLTQKGILRAAKWTTSSQSAETSARHPAPLTNTHFHWLILLGKKMMLPWLLTASLLLFSLCSPLMPSPPLSAPIDKDSSNMCSCSMTGRAFEIYCYVAGCYYESEYNWDCAAFVCAVPAAARSGVDCVWSACDINPCSSGWG